MALDFYCLVFSESLVTAQPWGRLGASGWEPYNPAFTGPLSPVSLMAISGIETKMEDLNISPKVPEWVRKQR